ncbi:MAG: LysR family transcriptional regulator [Planctomycetia bacterium]|nr:MAG: LysR family transcriptional regulator [Planctomycetia bacterium]RIK71052.1 MAG: LysR family transcriptional regulator [Planctomycetota bacterium]
MIYPNYHHLYYFWMVAREGSILAASRKLHVSQPTISAQIRMLERSLGQPLFHRHGRRLELTETGHIALRYADAIFTLGRELSETLRGRPVDRPQRFVVGVADAVPKLIAYHLLEPALHLPEGVELVCREGKPDKLLADLAIHELDLVISDSPIGPNVSVRAFSHLLGESPLAVFGAPALARKYRARFPASLTGAPILMPAETCTIRRMLNQWMLTTGITPRIVGQFEDSALMKAFGHAGSGLFFGPKAIATEIEQQYGVQCVGTIPVLRERIYAISVERRIRHPAVLAVSGSARRELLRTSNRLSK